MKPSRARARTPGRNQPGRRVNSDEALLQPVEVYCRVKPLDEGEERCVRVIGDKVIEITPPDGSLAVRAQTQNAKATQYTFTRVFDEQVDQKEIFDVMARPLVSDLIRGKNGLLFAYGNTGSGKTYTMTGDSQNGGIMPRAVDVLFNTVSSLLAPKHIFKPDKLNGFDVQSSVDAMADSSRDYLSGMTTGTQNPRTPGRNRADLIDSSGARVQDTSLVSGVDSDILYGVFITYVEIYNNNVYDLLDAPQVDSMKSKQQTFQAKILREDATRRMYVHSVNEVEVRTSDEAIDLFKKGQKRRRVAQTTLNAESSRSHSIFTIRLVQAPYNSEGTEVIQDKNYLNISQLSLVDLAGCERSNRTNTKGDRLKEAGNINNTLMTLRSCIETLRENQQTGGSKMVPYRDSKITHIFKSYFEGEGRIKMVVCVNPRAEDFDETILVMRFAEMTQEVAVQTQTTRPSRNDLAFTPGRRRANVLFQEAMNRVQAEDLQRDNAQVDMDAIFSLGTFPPHELFDDDDDGDVVSNLVEFLRHRNQTRQSLIEQQHARKLAFRIRLSATDQEIHQLRYENESLKGRLDAEIGKTRKLETDIINLRHSSETKTRRITELEKRISSKEQDMAETEHQLKQAQAESERIKAKYTTKLYDEKEKIQRRVEMKKSEETEQLKNQILARERQLKRIGVMALKPEKYPGRTAPIPTASSDTDLQTVTSRIRTESENRPSRRDRAEPVTRHRRSRSTGTSDKWLDHRPLTVNTPLGTVLQPKLPNRRSVTNLTDVRDVGTFDKYVLTTQENDSAGDLETKLYKGNVFPTSGGGAQVVLDDVEILKQTSPTRVRKRHEADPVLPADVIEARCRTGATEGHGSKKFKR